MSSPSGVRMSGPLLVFTSGFREDLARRGYRPGTAAKHLQLMAHVSRWLTGGGLEAGDVTTARVEQFLQERRASERSQLVSLQALSPMLDYLRALGVVPVAEPVAPSTPGEALIDQYSAYLLERRGLCRSSVRNYVNVARVFFSDREMVAGGLALEELDGAAVSEFVLREARRCSVGSAKCMVTRLRSLLRFLYVEGDIERDLTGAVPRVASWRLASLVKALDAQSVALLLGSCDPCSNVGGPDFAVLILLSRLGLHAREVAAMRLEDIDWRAGEIMVRERAAARSGCRCPPMSAKQ